MKEYILMTGRINVTIVKKSSDKRNILRFMFLDGTVETEILSSLGFKNQNNSERKLFLNSE